ncbi:MAG: hypothetical protein ABIO35_07240 [Nitrobacter sp.]
MPTPSTLEFSDGNSEDRRIAVTTDQTGSGGSPSIARSPGKHATVCAKIRRVDKERFSEVGERRFSAFEPPVRLCAENEAMCSRRRPDPATSIRVFERREKVLSVQRLCGHALEHDM